MKISTKKIVYVALLAAICTVLNVYDIPLTTDTRISLVYIPTFLAGFYFGPIAGFLVGAIGDGLGCILFPKGAWLPLMTLSSGLMGMIPGFIRTIKLNNKILILLSFCVTFIVCSVFLNTFAIWIVYFAAKKTFWVYLVGVRLIPQSLNMLANLIITILLAPFFHRLLMPRAEAMKKPA